MVGGIAATTALAAVMSYVAVTLGSPLEPAAPEIARYQAPDRAVSDLAWPGFGASAIGADGYDGVLDSSGSDAALPIASISKIITALVVLDEHPLAGSDGPSITLTAADAALYDSYLEQDGTVVPARAGMVFSERQLLEITLVASANNYTETLATWAFGSVPEFAVAADAWLDERGLADTTIVEPTGMAPQNTSTAADLVALGRLATNDPLVSAIVSTPAVVIPELGELRNTNRLLGLDGVDGIKTGNLDGIGSNLLFSADYPVGGGMVSVVGVVLGAADRDALYAGVDALLASVRAGFYEVELADAGQRFASFSTPWDATASAIAEEGASVVVWRDTPVMAEVRVDRIQPESFGETVPDVGSVTFTAGPRTVIVALHLDAPIEEPDPWWRLTHPFDADRAG